MTAKQGGQSREFASRKRSPLRRVHESAVGAGARLAYRVNGVGRRLAEIERAMSLSPAELEAEVMARVRGQLAHGFANVPHYREIARRGGLAPEAFETYGELAKLPVLTRKNLRENLAALVAEEMPHGRGKESYSGGSTGEPVRFLQDAYYKRMNWADKAYWYEVCGYRLGEPVALLSASSFWNRMHNSVVSRARDRWLTNLLWVNCFRISIENLARWSERIAAHDPTLLGGFTSALALYAVYLQTTGARRPRPRAIQTTAELLTEADRELLEGTFGCPVLNRYGCMEAGIAAHECERRTGLHVPVLTNVVEVVNEAGEPCAPGETGRLLITNLTNGAMPLIRYQVGDLAAWAEGPCACGRSLPRLQHIVGRESEIILSPGGKLLHSEFFMNVVRPVKGIQAMQIVQETLEELTFRWVPAPGADVQGIQATVGDSICRHGDPGFRVRFEVVSEIPPAPSGKRQAIISRLEEWPAWAPARRI
jgi:phenylacetate-CoA ligase